jgi:hypothetical protein
MPIPWTQRDSRPKSQAEQDKEESFNARKRLKIDYLQRGSQLHRKLEHYQEMINRIASDPDFRDKLDMADLAPSVQKLREERRQRVLKKGLYKKRAIREEERRQEGRRRFEQIHGKAPPPQPYFSHLDQVVQWWDATNWESNDTRPPPPSPPPLAPRPFNQEEFDQEMEKLYREYHIENNVALRLTWADSLSRLALRRLQVS